MKRVFRIEDVYTISMGQCLRVRGLDLCRVPLRGEHRILEKIQKGEISITSQAKKLILVQPLTTLQDVEHGDAVHRGLIHIFSSRVISYYSRESEIVIPINTVIVHGHRAREWFLDCIVVEKNLR